MPRLFRQLRSEQDTCVRLNGTKNAKKQHAVLLFADLWAENNEPISSALRA